MASLSALNSDHPFLSPYSLDMRASLIPKRYSSDKVLEASGSELKVYDSTYSGFYFYGGVFKYSVSRGAKTLDLSKSKITRYGYARLLSEDGPARVAFDVTGFSVAGGNYLKLLRTKNGSGLKEYVFRGADRIEGTQNPDFLIGYNGNDTLIGGGGSGLTYSNVTSTSWTATSGGGLQGDTLTGGAGADLFKLTEPGGTITDFSPKQGDRLYIGTADVNRLDLIQVPGGISIDIRGASSLPPLRVTLLGLTEFDPAWTFRFFTDLA